jgi:HK97 gp10 family phage protein
MKLKIDLETKALLSKLKRLPVEMQDKAIKQGVRAGASTVQREAKKNAPVDMGLLKSRVRVKTAKKRYSEGFLMVVNVKAPHHHLIELGTADREPKNKKKLAFEGPGGKMFYAKKVKGVKANPFLGKAYETKKDEVVKKFRETIDKFINKQKK